MERFPVELFISREFISNFQPTLVKRLIVIVALVHELLISYIFFVCTARPCLCLHFDLTNDVSLNKQFVSI